MASFKTLRTENWVGSMVDGSKARASRMALAGWGSLKAVALVASRKKGESLMVMVLLRLSIVDEKVASDFVEVTGWIKGEQMLL